MHVSREVITTRVQDQDDELDNSEWYVRSMVDGP